MIDLFIDFDDLCNELEILDTDNNLVSDRFTIQDEYDDVVASSRLILAEHSIQLSANNSLNAVMPIVHSSEQNSIIRKKIKLPAAPLPSFEGRIEDWMSFKDTFVSMIHNDPDLSNVQKLQYLKSILKGDAARKIQIFSISEENYGKAWELLQRSYENRRHLIGRHLSLLLKLPNQERESARGIGELADVAQQHIQSLETLGIKISPEIVVQIIEEKLYKTTLEKWEETLSNEFPSLDDLFEFLYRTAARLSRKGRDRIEICSVNNSFHQSPIKFRKTDNRRHNVLVAIKDKKCPVCNGKQHFLYHCQRFRSLSLKDKIRIVNETKSCDNCLRSKHTGECKYGCCRICQAKHNTLLHQAPHVNPQKVSL